MTPEKEIRLAILASGAGTNTEAIIRYFDGDPRIKVALIMTNQSLAGVLEIARLHHIDHQVFTREQWLGDSVFKTLEEKKIAHIVLAGFLWLVPPHLLRAFPDRIINIHPSLLPKFGGKGMYGMKVHEAVKQAGEKETGITIHLVNEQFDKGRILFQAHCPLSTTDQVDDIARKVRKLEHEYYPMVIRKWADGTQQ